MDKLFIPDKIKVGFQERKDTYTQKLAYVIYYDKAGKLRKEKSWESWRNKSIEPIEYSNVPTEGFVLNKKVGGYKSDWNFRQAYVRVYDPRGFEFEIDVPNLLYILANCDCSRGKGLEGQFVYSWDGTDLVLLPTSSPDFSKCTEYSLLQNTKIKKKDLKVGYQYKTKDNEIVTYLGKLDYYYPLFGYDYSYRNKIALKGNGYIKRDIWATEKNTFVEIETKKLAIEYNQAINYAELLELYYKSKNGTKPVRLFLQDNPDKAQKITNPYYVQSGTNSYDVYEYGDYGRTSDYVKLTNSIVIDNNVVSCQSNNNAGIYWNPKVEFDNRKVYGWYDLHRTYKTLPPDTTHYMPPNNQVLCVELESGSKFLVDNYYGYKEMPVLENQNKEN